MQYLTSFFTSRLNRRGFLIGSILILILDITSVLLLYTLPHSLYIIIPYSLVRIPFFSSLFVRRMHDMGYPLITGLILSLINQSSGLLNVIQLVANLVLGTNLIELSLIHSATIIPQILTVGTWLILAIIRGQNQGNNYGSQPSPQWIDSIKQLFFPLQISLQPDAKTQ